MIRFQEVQSTAAALVSAYALAYELPEQPLAELPIIEDKGTDTNETEMEEALKTRACYVAFTVPVKGKLVDQKAGRTILEVQVLAWIALNTQRNDPEKNPEALGLELLDLVKHVHDAVINPAERPVNPQDRFGLAEDALVLDTLDAGLFRYQLTFTKRCVL